MRWRCTFFSYAALVPAIRLLVHVIPMNYALASRECKTLETAMS
jgi:hypothetical protein